jgi:hypothetical protein
MPTFPHPETTSPNAREENEVSSKNDEKNSAEVTCPRCEGCGQLANSDEREPWSVWMALPVGSALAVTMGIVKPEPCDECGGTGKAPGEQLGNDSTWCVHVHGPDDVLPAADRHDAMRQAHALNASFIDHIASENPELSDYYPCMWAVATLRSNA